MLRRIAAIFASALMVLGVMVGLAGPASAQSPLKQVNNGMKIIFSANPSSSSSELSDAEWDQVLNGDAFCTMGPVGTDKYGNSVGITAGHCVYEYDVPIYAYHAASKETYDEGPIGVTVYRSPDSDQVYRDYRVIQFDTSKVVLSAQGPHLKIQQQVFGILGAAFFNNNILIKSGARTGASFGRITNNSNGLYQSWAGHNRGDSGGAAIWKSPTTLEPGPSNGFQSTGPWAGIVTRNAVGVPSAIYTSADNIQKDMTAKDASNGATEFVGAGFVPTP